LKICKECKKKFINLIEKIIGIKIKHNHDDIKSGILTRTERRKARKKISDLKLIKDEIFKKLK